MGQKSSFSNNPSSNQYSKQYWLSSSRAENERQAGKSLSNRRDPASIHRHFDFSRLTGKALALATEKRILNDIRVFKKESYLGIEMGHFVVKGENGQKEFACDHYDRVTLSFVAEGMAENGSPVKMEVDSPCVVGDEIERIKPVWLPIADIKKRRPAEFKQEIIEAPTFEQDPEILDGAPPSYSPSKAPTFFTVFNGSFYWPDQWRLESVKLSHQIKFQREIAVDAKKVRKLLARPLLIDW